MTRFSEIRIVEYEIIYNNRPTMYKIEYKRGQVIV